MKISVITPTIRGIEALKMAEQSLHHQTFFDFEWLTDDSKGHNKAMNRLIKRAQGELIVSLQDYIKIRPDGLQKFWDKYQLNKKLFFTAPVGKTLDFKEIKWDWRYHREENEPTNFMEWEIDWAAAPKAALVEIGGFDEELDGRCWEFGNVNTGLRAELAGYKVMNVRDNPAIGYDHNKSEEYLRERRGDAQFHNWRLQEIRMGKKIEFLNNQQ